MRTVREGILVILPRNERIVDVFVDKGWDNHILLQVKDGQLKQIKGPYLTPGQTKFINFIVLGIRYQPPVEAQ